MRKVGLRFAVLTGFVMLFLAAANAARAAHINPVPLINQPLVPTAAAPGSGNLTLTVNGTGFVTGSVVNWNGAPLSTQFVSTERLTATVPASNLLVAGTGLVSVVNPGPGGGTSNTMPFEIGISTASVFFSGSALAVGNAPVAEVTGDFNADGIADLAVANYDDGTVSVLLGNGDGTFMAQSIYAVGSNPVALVTADFNGDGKPDLAAVNKSSNTVSVLLGTGSGTFLPKVDYAVGHSAAWVVAGDFNDDGKVDLAVTNGRDNNISILLGKGDGTFQNQVTYPTALDPSGLVTADFNGDGQLDLVATDINSNAVSVLLGRGDGTFGTHTEYATGVYPISVATADLNADGKLDLAVANQDSTGIGTVSVLLGNGDGTFQPAVGYFDGQLSKGVTISNLNGDGAPDLVIPNHTSETISMLLGNGDGTFQTAINLPLDFAPSQVVFADFNGDGRLDMATGNVSSNTVSVLLQSTMVPGPNSLAFGNQLVGNTSPSQTVTLTNNGQQSVSLTSILSQGTNAGDFTVTSACPTSLAAGASCTVTVKFRPPKDGNFSAQISITDNAVGSPQTVPMTGSGTGFTLSPTNIGFGSQKVGTTSLPQNVTLTNLAPVSLPVTAVKITGTHASNFAQTNTCGTSLPGKSSCTISVTFTPSQTGTVKSTLEVDGGGGGPLTASLSGNGT
ncbi:MAG TPA: FG-GAP-like repeat-containing protein [Terriglobia bacterium]